MGPALSDIKVLIVAFLLPRNREGKQNARNYKQNLEQNLEHKKAMHSGSVIVLRPMIVSSWVRKIRL